MRKGTVASMVAALALGLLVAGCGDDDNGTDGSKAAFVKEANELCTEINKGANGEVQKAYTTAAVKGASTEREAIQLEVSVFTPIFIEAAEALVSGIGELDPPSGDEDEIEAILTAYEKWIEKAEGAPFKIVIDDDIYTEARDLSGKYGLDACAQSPFQLG